MLVNRTILGIVCIVATFIARIIYPHAYVTKYFEGRKVKSKLAAIFFWIFGIISIITGLIFSVWSIIKFINDFSFLGCFITVAFIGFEASAITGDTDFGAECANIAIVIGIIAAIIHGVIWVWNYESPYVDCNDEHVEISTIEIMSATDGTMVQGNISGGGFLVYHISGSINESPVYRYYYQLEDGGIKLGQIPADLTTIYFVENGETPYIEVIKSSLCNAYNTKTGEHTLRSTSTTYKLYVPEGSILEVFQFDGS